MSNESQMNEFAVVVEELQQATARFHKIAEKLERRAGELERKYIPLKMARHYCGYDERTIRDAIKAGDIEAFSPNGGKKVVKRAELDAWIERDPLVYAK